MKFKTVSSLFAGLLVSLSFLTPEAVAQGVSILPPDGTISGMDIATGRVHMVHFPALVLYWIQMLLSLVGGCAVIMIMVGGVQYMIGTVSNDKESGKKTILYAISGMLVAFFAWWIVELIQVWITS